MIGAILSSFNSALNSTCTLFSLGIYKEVVNKDADEHAVVNSGKYFGVAIALVSMAVAPMLLGQDSIFGYLQKMNGIYFIPLLGVIVVGMLTKRVPALAAKVGLLVGFTVILVGYFVPMIPVESMVDGVSVTVLKPFESSGIMHGFHFLGAAFALIVVTMLVIGKIKPRKTDFVQEDVQAVGYDPMEGCENCVWHFDCNSHWYLCCFC